MLFIGVCRLLGGLLSVACGMYRYAFYRCVSVAFGWLLLVLTFAIYPLFSSFLCFSLLFVNFYSSLFYSSLVWAVASGMYRYAFYGCVSIAWEIAPNAYSMASTHSILF